MQGGNRRPSVRELRPLATTAGQNMSPKNFTSSGSFRPFGCLEGLVKHPPAGPLPVTDGRWRRSKRRGRGQPAKVVPDGRSSDELFRAAMADVTPINRGNCLESTGDPPGAPGYDPAADPSETVDRLRRLVDCGEGFIVAHTPEYMEGVARDVHPETARRLHRGDFAIQAHIDLHGR